MEKAFSIEGVTFYVRNNQSRESVHKTINRIQDRCNRVDDFEDLELEKMYD